MSRKELLGPVKVSRIHAIDEMKGKYRSPRRALFMSLVVPGSGQMYVGGSTFNYVRGAAYMVAEVALASGWYYNSVYKYDQQVSKYKSYAREHYSVGWYEKRMHGLWNQLSDENVQEPLFNTLYGTVREEYCQNLYGNSAQFGCFSKETPFENDGAHVAHFDTVSLGTSLSTTVNKGLPANPDAFYRMLASDELVLGWDDVDSMRTVAELDISNAEDYSYVSLGSSKNLAQYKAMRTRANELADMQAWFLGGLILNHLVSAVDATLAARSHNMELYEEKLTWLDKMRFDSRINVQDGFSASVNALWGF